jgi:hypothetical protein
MAAEYKGNIQPAGKGTVPPYGCLETPQQVGAEMRVLRPGFLAISLIIAAAVQGNAQVTVRRSDGSKFVPNEYWTDGPYYASKGSFFADVTGDGKADAIVVDEYRVTVRPSDGSRFLPNEYWTADPYYGDRGTFVADVTGDRRADAVVVSTTPPSPPPSVKLAASPNGGYNCLGTKDTLTWTVSNCGSGCDVTLTGHGHGYASSFNITLPHLRSSGSYSTTPGDQIDFTVTASSQSGQGSATKSLTIAPPNMCPGGGSPSRLSPYWFAVKASNPSVPQCAWLLHWSDSESHAKAELVAVYGPEYTVTSITEDDFNHQRKCP